MLLQRINDYCINEQSTRIELAYRAWQARIITVILTLHGAGRNDTIPGSPGMLFGSDIGLEPMTTGEP